MKKNISEMNIKNAYIQAAHIVAKYGTKYLPIFERLEQELNERKNQSAVEKRALQIALTSNIDT